MNQVAPILPFSGEQAEERVVLPLAPSLEKRRLQIYIFLLIADYLAVLGSFSLADRIYIGSPTNLLVMLAAQVLVALYLTAGLLMQVYSRTALIRLDYAVGRAVAALFASMGMLLFIGFATKSTDSYSRIGILLGCLISVVAVVAVRVLARPAIRARCGPAAINVLVIDDGGAPLRVPNAYHVNAKANHLSPDLSDPHTLDRVGLYMVNMDRVLVSCPPERRPAWALLLKSANVVGEIFDHEVLALGAMGATRGPGFGALVVSIGPLGLRARASKRLLDLVLAGGAIVVLAPLLLLVALLIKLEDGGPVLFVQQRTGRGNRFFSIFKFRSMRVERSDQDGKQSASRDDNRVTRIGYLIRRTSIDELPQLFNVLRGEMSVVGPRPHAIGSLAGEKLFWEVDQRYWLRHALKPGLTGLAQIRGLRGATETENDLAARLLSDLEYAVGWTIWRDVMIIVRTLKVIVHPQAY
jgi:lipopolysaccharide/colanic/teichoic acid biosynthesis glycosyltransferase